MKRFILFGYDTYYPNGGSGDIRGDFDTLNELKLAIKNADYKRDWYEYFDCETREFMDIVV